MIRALVPYLLPGLVFQGVIIGGGYATGRELVEFFWERGPWGGLLGMAVTAAVFSIVMAISFELCRRWQCYDYRTFFRLLLGRFWVVYDLMFCVLIVLVISVVGSASGILLQDLLGVGIGAGTAAFLLAVAMLVLSGSAAIERFLGLWSLVLYAAYGALVIGCLNAFGGEAFSAFSYQNHPTGFAWIADGVRYASYNLAVVPAIFFVLHRIRTRRHALGAGLIAGVLGVVPAAMLYVAMTGAAVDMSAEQIPTAVLLRLLDWPALTLLFPVVLLGTFVQTGVGLIHAVNERVDSALSERGRSANRYIRLAVSSAVLVLSLYLANRFGIVALIAGGYGMLTYGFLLVFVLPVMTVGLVTLLSTSQRGPKDPLGGVG